MLQTLAIKNYRSLRDLKIPLAGLNVVTGANGSGKSSLYRALRLLAEGAGGGLIRALAREGGLPSVLWAGPERISRAMRRGEVPIQGTLRKNPVRLGLGFSSEALSYAAEWGFPKAGPQMSFPLDPEYKFETLWAGPRFHPRAILLSRRGPLVRWEGTERSVEESPSVDGFESAVHRFSDPYHTPESIALRDLLASWRFYDHLRCDEGAPCRAPQVGTYTPFLSHDGADLAAAWSTIFRVGDATGLARSVEDAFPGSSIEVLESEGRFDLAMRQPGMLRPLSSRELSEGTMRFLMLAVALHAPRPPALMVLNEPEANLHEDLLPSLASLIRAATEVMQLVVITHSARLAEGLAEGGDAQMVRLRKDCGETFAEVDGETLAAWRWPE